MKGKFVLYYYLVSVFLLANGAFSNYIFSMVHLNIWRQLIWFVGLFIVSKSTISKHSFRIRRLFDTTKKLFGWILFCSFVTIAIYAFNPVRIIYAWWMYFSGIPFVLLPYVLRKNNWPENKINNLFVFFGLFQTIGLLTDYVSGGMFTTMFAMAGDNTENLLESGRYCFTAEAPTTFGIYYSFCLLMTLKNTVEVNSFLKRILLILFSFMYIISAWFTGSRQIVAAMSIVLVTGLFFIFMYDKSVRKVIIIIMVMVAYQLPSLYSKLTQDEIYADRFNTETIKEDDRSKQWHDGFAYCIADMVPKRFLIGEAVGLSMGMKAAPGEVVGSHYENSIWSRMSETGLIGLILLLYPVIYLRKGFNRHRLMDVLTLAFMISYVMTCYVSPNGLNQTAQMSVYLALGMYIYSKDYGLS